MALFENGFVLQVRSFVFKGKWLCLVKTHLQTYRGGPEGADMVLSPRPHGRTEGGEKPFWKMTAKAGRPMESR